MLKVWYFSNRHFGMCVCLLVLIALFFCYIAEVMNVKTGDYQNIRMYNAPKIVFNLQSKEEKPQEVEVAFFSVQTVLNKNLQIPLSFEQKRGDNTKGNEEENRTFLELLSVVIVILIIGSISFMFIYKMKELK